MQRSRIEASRRAVDFMPCLQQHRWESLLEDLQHETLTHPPGTILLPGSYDASGILEESLEAMPSFSLYC